MPNWTVDRPEHLTFDTVNDLEVSVTSGRVNVVGGTVPRVEVTKVTGPPVAISHQDGRLRVRHAPRRAGDSPFQALLDWLLTGNHSTSEISISVPPDCRVKLEVESGPIVVSNLRNDTAVRGTSGDITLADMDGRAAASTVSGNITAASVEGDLRTHTTSGSITVVAGTRGRINATSTSGEITVDVQRPEPRDVDLTCVSGRITVRLPYRSDLDIDMTSAHGSATCGFPEIEVLRLHGMCRIRGTLGDGSGRLHGHTTSGALTLLRRHESEEDHPTMATAADETVSPSPVAGTGEAAESE